MKIGPMRNLEAMFTSRPVLLILLLGLILNLSGTWLVPLIDRDEPRFAEASREMLERNDWVVPWFNGQPRYDKPPLIYWAQMLCYRCLGETPFAARLPSALFATGTSLLIFFWAKRRTKPITALAAAVSFTTCLQMAVHARLAVADMPMIFFVCAALWSGWESTRPETASRWRWWWVFYVSLALGFLAKGPVAWLPLAGLLLGKWLRPQQFILTPARLTLGLLLTLGIVALWGVPALWHTHGEFMYVGLGHHVIDRSLGTMDGHGARSWLGWVATSPYYLLTFFFSFFPWAFRVPPALRNWWPTRQTDVFGWYLLAQTGVVFLVFTVVRTKLPHYTLPAFPCLAIWLAKAGEDGLLKNWWRGRLVKLAAILVVLLIIATIAWLLLKVWWVGQLTMIAAGMTALIITAVLIGLLQGWRGAKMALLMVALILTITLAGGLAIRPAFVALNLFDQVRPQLAPDMKFATVQYTEPSLVWKFREVLTNDLQELSAREAADFSRTSPPSILIIPTGLYQTNRAVWGTNLSVVQVRGINWVTFNHTELTALIHP